MESKSFKEIQMDIYGIDVAELPNGNIMVTCYFTGAINVYDENFKLIKKVTSVNNQAFKGLNSTTNHKDKIFISDHSNNRVMMTNLDFEYINSYTVSQPWGICFHRNLYTCGYGESKIYKHDENLNLIQSFSLTIKPRQIKVNDEKAIVSSDGLIQIYDSLTFTNIFATINIKIYEGNICLFNDLLINTQGSDFYFYDMQGKLIKKIENLLPVSSLNYHGLDLISNKLILTRRNGNLYIFESNFVSQHSNESLKDKHIEKDMFK